MTSIIVTTPAILIVFALSIQLGGWVAESLLRWSSDPIKARVVLNFLAMALSISCLIALLSQSVNWNIGSWEYQYTSLFLIGSATGTGLALLLALGSSRYLQSQSRVFWIITIVLCALVATVFGVLAHKVALSAPSLSQAARFHIRSAEILALLGVLAVSWGLIPGIALALALRTVPNTIVPTIQTQLAATAPLKQRLRGLFFMGGLWLIITLWTDLVPCRWLDVLLQSSGCLQTHHIKAFGDNGTLAFLSDSTLLSAHEKIDTVQINNIQQQLPITILPLEPVFFVEHATFAADGNVVALATFRYIEGVNDMERQKHISLWNIPDGSLRATWPSGDTSMSFSPDSQQIATLGVDRRLHIRKTADGSLVRTFPRWSVLSPDWTMLLTNKEHNTLALHRTSDLTILNTFQTHSHFLWSSRWSPDGSLLVLMTRAQELEIWNVQDGQYLHTIPYIERARELGWDDNYPYLFPELVWSPDSTVLALALNISGDRFTQKSMLWLWSVPQATLLRETVLHDGHNSGNALYAITWAPDGSRLATLSDNIVRIWRAP